MSVYSLLVIKTPRLTLRPPRLEDAAAIQPLFARWEIIRFMRTHVPWPYPADGAVTYLRDTLLPDMARHKALAFAMCLGDAVVGLITFKKEEKKDIYEVGFWIGQPYWGQGYMAEALNAALAHYPDIQVYATCAADNRASARVQEKCGFAFKGIVQAPIAHHCGATTEEYRERVS